MSGGIKESIDWLVIDTKVSTMVSHIWQTVFLKNCKIPYGYKCLHISEPQLFWYYMYSNWKPFPPSFEFPEILFRILNFTLKVTRWHSILTFSAYRDLTFDLQGGAKSCTPLGDRMHFQYSIFSGGTSWMTAEVLQYDSELNAITRGGEMWQPEERSNLWGWELD